MSAAARGLLGVDYARTTTVAEHSLGTKTDGDDGTIRVYARAGAAIAQYDALTQDAAEGAFDWQPTSAADTPVFGVAPIAVADNAFFWAIKGGKANVKVAAAVTAGAVLVTTGTAGTLDDTAAAAGNALGAGSGLGVVCITDDTPSAGIALVLLT